MSDLLDQSPLIDLAERLVAAARRAGADAADAVAVRSVSQSVELRDGKVEESERSEGDDMGLRVLVGKRQAVVSTNDVKGNGADALAERAVAMARVAPEDPYAGLADAGALARDFPELDLIDARVPDVAALERSARAAEEAALGVKGVTKSGGASAAAGIGGVVLATSHGFRGAYVSSRHSISAMAIAGEGTGMERDYDFTSALHASDLEAAEQIGRSAGERAIQRLNPRKVETRRVPIVFDPRIAGSLVGHLASAINGASVARKTSFLRDRMGERLFRPGIRIVDDPHRWRGLRSHPFDGEGVAGKVLAVIEDGVLRSWFLDSATARELSLVTTGHASRGVSSSPSPSPTNLHLEAGAKSPQELIADITDGFYVTDLIGMGANLVTGDYSRGASGRWIENGELTYPVSEVTIAGHLNDIFASLEPANDLTFRYGTNAPTVRMEGLTVAAIEPIARAPLKEELAGIVREAGALAASTFRRELKHWTKHGGSPVTEADIAVDRLLRERLTRLVPDVGWLSEESEDDRARLDGTRLWIVDPIDGTRAYVNGRTDWAVSVALVEHGRPIAGAIFAPMEDGLYLAVASEGATRDGAPMAASTGDDFTHARVAGPKPVIEHFARSAAGIIAEPKVHSLALRMARTASGRLDIAFASADSHDWDLAAADLIVHEAGGALTRFDGAPLVYNSAEARHEALVAAGRPRHARVVEIVREWRSGHDR